MQAAAIASKLGRIIAAGPSVSVILPDATTVDGVRCQLHQSRVAALAGYANQYRGSVLVTVPGTLPTIRALCQVAGTWYRIIGVEQDSAGAGLRLDLGEGASQQ
jgi:hypothetical protein